MPTYEYECTGCSHRFEEFASITAPRRQRCPLCRCKVDRLISGGTGILFKGSGFYATDSRAKKGSESPPAAEASGSGGDQPKAEKKAAGKKGGPASGSS